MSNRGKVAVVVVWDGSILQVPDGLQWIPQDVYDAGYLEEDAVSNWLEAQFGFPVIDWILT